MATDATRYKVNVDRFGLSKIHRQTLAWVTPGATVLELGCASGYLGGALIREKGCTVTGVEIDPSAAVDARACGLAVREGSIDDRAFRQSLGERFDFVLANDVLEHLHDPWSVVDDIKAWLRPAGLAIISVPNIANLEIRRRLFFSGSFEYEESGIMDRTHLRFFTWRSLRRLLHDRGWEVRDSMIDCWHFPVGQQLLVDLPKRMRRAIESADQSGVRFGRLGRWIAGLQESGEALSNRITALSPNLFASQVAVLVRPLSQGSPP